MPTDMTWPCIIAAAIRLDDGTIYKGTRHALIMVEIWNERGFIKILQEHQGFLDSKGKFWSRYKAGAIAHRAGQTKTRKENLLSEDLW